MNELIFKDKVAIITGASRGIGRAIALELARQGAKIAFNYVKSDNEAKSLLEELESLGNKGLSCKFDVRDYKTAVEFVANVKEFFGGLDFLINNAGISRGRALMNMEQEDWQVIIDTNLTGCFNLSRACIVTFLKQKHGNIINISSIAGVSGISRLVNYSASKAGIIGFTKALAKETAPYGIRVNCVAPGFIETDMTTHMKEDEKKHSLEKIPIGRFGKTEEVAKTVSFLLSERSGYITGQVIKVDGGLHTSY